MQAFHFPITLAEVDPKHRYIEHEGGASIKRARANPARIEESPTLTQQIHARVNQALIEKARELATDVNFQGLMQRYAISADERVLCLQSIPTWLSQYSIEMRMVVSCVISICLESGMVPQHEASVAAISQLAKQQLLLKGPEIHTISREISIYQNYEQSRRTA